MDRDPRPLTKQERQRLIESVVTRRRIGTQLELLMAASLIHILPTIALIYVAQRYFIKGIALTGLNG